MKSVGKMWDKGTRKFLLVGGKAYNVYKNDYKKENKDPDWNVTEVSQDSKKQG